MKEINLDEGYSMNYLIPAFFIIAIGLGLFFVHFILALLLIVPGVLILFAKTGVTFSGDLKSGMDYKSILGYKYGEKYDLTKYQTVELKYTNEANLMQSRGSSTVVRTKTYDLILSSHTEKKIQMHEFTDYQLARKAFSILVNKLGYHGHDEVAEIRNEIAKNQPRKRRK